MRFLPTVEGSYFAAPSRNNSASYKANLHEVCPTKVRGMEPDDLLCSATCGLGRMRGANLVVLLLAERAR
jgi:hypothetical protein